MAQMYRVATVLSSISSGTTYTAPTKTTSGYENGIHSITFKAKGADATIHDTSSYASGTQFTITENDSLTFNQRYLEGKEFFIKSTSTVEILIVPGVGT